MVFSVRLLSATTRFVVRGSKPLSTHSTDVKEGVEKLVEFMKKFEEENA